MSIFLLFAWEFLYERGGFIFSSLSILVSVVLGAYYIHLNDRNTKKLYRLFEVLFEDLKPTMKKKAGDTYYFILPLGLPYAKIQEKENAIKDAFPLNALSIAFEYGLLKIKITNPLPKKINFNNDMLGSNFLFPVGMSIDGMIYHDFDKIPHILAAGMTRYGKTVFLRLLLVTLLMQRPESVKFVILDLKGGLSFLDFERLKQTHTIASDINESVDILNIICGEIKGRQLLFKQQRIDKIQKAKGMKRVFIVVDEAAQLMSAGRKGKEAAPYKDCERALAYIAQVGAGLGFHLVYCTQYPTLQSLPQQVKANCDATISFRLRNSTANRVVFDDVNMAEDLPYIPGRAIYQADKDTEIQVPMVSEEQIRELTKPHERGVLDEQKADVKNHEAGKDLVIFR